MDDYRKAFEEIMKNDPMGTLRALVEFERLNQQGVVAIETSITFSSREVSVRVGGRKDVIDCLGLDDDIAAFSEEIKPIMAKYAEVVSRKFDEFLRKDPKESSKRVVAWMMSEGLPKKKISRN